MTANPLRGEVTATLGALTLTLAIDMDGLARLSAATGHPTLAELHQRLAGAEPVTVFAALDLFIVKGARDGKPLSREDARAVARSALTLDDLIALQGPLAGLLACLLRPRAEAPPKGNA